MKTILRATVHRYPTGSLLPVWVNVWVTGTVWVTRKKIRWLRRNNRLTSIRESYLKLLMDLRNALFMIRFPVKRSTDGLGGAPFTFFAYKGVIYNSAEAVMAAFTGNGTNVVGYDFAGKTWGDVEKLTKVLKENDPVGYRRFLTQKAKGKTTTDRLTEAEAYQLSWNNYMYVTFGYSLGSNGTSIINLNGKDTRRLLARYGLHTYADGVCYYTHWIRHSNNNDPSKGIMEYAIVRNNVYKLRLSDIYGLGRDIPYEPPFDPEPVDPTPPGPDDPDNPPTPPGPDDPDNPPTPPGPDDPDNPPTPPGPDDPDDPDIDPLIQIEVVVKPWLIIDPETFYF